jgi:hypothetical protein
MMTKDEARKIAAGIGRQMTASGAWLALLAVLATAKASCGGSALLFEAPFRFALRKSIIGTARADGARDPGEKPAC